MTTSRNPGDAWVEAPDGSRYWGLFGAAGLLAHDPARGVLLQHRVGWSHFGGTWGIPGGALHEGETPLAGALREAGEEAGVPRGSVVPRAEHVYDVADLWRYTTVIADVAEPFEPVISDPESLELAWVPVDEVDQLELHPGFAASWPTLRAALGVRPVVLVDAANVVGSVPDGWWKDRRGAAEKLRGRLEALAAAGVDADALGLELFWWHPIIATVVEGQARDVGAGTGAVAVFRAEASGDDEIVARAEAMVEAGLDLTVVTSDRELQGRVEALGARVRGARWLRDQLPPADPGASDAVTEAGMWTVTGVVAMINALWG
ncbi:NUDIX domain-containing protein [Microbacterium excoecariae]|uniref:NUDIX domain-containing protein n=1 Tax=Microbacterium excoecariae TaxID=2715210 RepID=UPI00140BC47D|nr:NUDIX domain-containing protein [Microbacterium excoecariae]